jgi:hypothetical protein
MKISVWEEMYMILEKDTKSPFVGINADFAVVHVGLYFRLVKESLHQGIATPFQRESGGDGYMPRSS